MVWSVMTCRPVRSSTSIMRAGIGDAGGEGLFDEGVAAAFEGHDGLLGVQMVWARNHNCIWSGLVEQLLVVVAGGGIGVFVQCLFKLRAVRIEEADDLAAAVGGCDMGAVKARSSGAADKESYWRHSIVSPCFLC